MWLKFDQNVFGFLKTEWFQIEYRYYFDQSQQTQTIQRTNQYSKHIHITSVKRWKTRSAKGGFHFAKISSSTSKSATGTRASNGNFQEERDDLWRLSTFFVLTGPNGNYRSFRTKFPFPLRCLLRNHCVIT